MKASMIAQFLNHHDVIECLRKFIYVEKKVRKEKEKVGGFITFAHTKRINVLVD